ncbi:MAG: YdcF family protein [Prochlorotrichaceae cyanobacterium]
MSIKPFKSLYRQRFAWLIGAIVVLLLGWSTIVIQVWHHTQAPIDGVLVLGGSIRREMYIAAAPNIPRPIVISGGSPYYCIQKVFDRYQADPTDVWIEPCATSTFENFEFAAPILQQLQVKHLRLVTSSNHIYRAEKLGKIMLGFRGIAVESFVVPEIGIPANQESRLKTVLDLSRGILWGLFSPILPPKTCAGLIRLSDLQNQTIAPAPCESQAGF